MTENTIKCALCGLECRMQISATHLRAAHKMTTSEYKALGHVTLSPARLEQLRNSPVGKGDVKHHCGEDHHNWKGGHLSRSGYRIVSRPGNNKIYEHRLIAEQMIGRPLAPDEVVHHIDANRSNNDPSNLVVMKRKEHDKLKDGARQYFYTNEDCENAAVDLYILGWPKARIERALRIHYQTLNRWLEKHSDKIDRPIRVPRNPKA